ncbi:Inositol monophosphatase [Hyphomicrobiales bacterium]|nr:Inositol monophosphatase [Hyphomicrobiales bacterium]CAH1698947.1 Inositol monophosphatase [Hyphomicrobiales bacterium]CAI0342592.1 inositol-phosphate phosphatase / L-galactose 1-phosphate phosphatase / histidinol-phosphatase [Hyphomicrobiales bacterium]
MSDAIATELLAFAGRLADEGRAIVGEAVQTAHKIDLKADQSFVTATDRAIEKRLRERIEAAYPGHGILGEEFGSYGLDREFVWVIDPIDGTAPFIAGIPVYGILIGIARAGRPWLGVMDLPATRERMSGISGISAQHNGVPVRCKPCDALAGAFLTSSNPRFLTEAEREALGRLDREVAFTQYGGSCYSYGCLARGNTDLAVDGGLDPFDVFATAAIIEGAGGIVSDWGGKPIDLGWKGQIAAAGDRRLHGHALAKLASAG